VCSVSKLKVQNNPLSPLIYSLNTHTQNNPLSSLIYSLYTHTKQNARRWKYRSFKWVEIMNLPKHLYKTSSYQEEGWDPINQLTPTTTFVCRSQTRTCISNVAHTQNNPLSPLIYLLNTHTKQSPLTFNLLSEHTHKTILSHL
jgi:hypothetical protein